MKHKNTKAQIDESIERASFLALENNESEIVSAIKILQDILIQTNLSYYQRLNAQMNLGIALQNRGEHSAAIETLNSIVKLPKKQPEIACWIKHLKATSYNTLGYSEEACKLFDEAIREIDKLQANPKLRAAVSLEAGKAFSSNGDTFRARKYWEEALKYYEGKDEEIEHYARTKANLASELLHDADNNAQEEGIRLLEESSEIKRRIGDLEGLANNYCNLGLYYFRKKRFEKAIAYLRRDLFISRKVGNLREIATSLGNLSNLYAVLRQLSPARDLLNEAKQIGEKLNDRHLIEITIEHDQIINSMGKEAGSKGEKIGPIADCGCGSGKTYQECCGRADFEPIDIPMIFGGVSEDLEMIINQVKSSGVEPSRLDFLLRKTDQSKQRMAWSRIHVHDGWVEMHELPDMANHHLSSAKLLADEAKSHSDESSKPLACVILSACALEAFINQVSFFLADMSHFPEGKSLVIPPELLANALDFQRTTRLEDKWDILGKILCGKNWPPPKDLWNNFQNLIYIRNELVHFKVADYEQVVPLPKKPHEITKRIPATVEIRKIPHSWPSRVLTASLADWCVDVSEKMIDYFKQGYLQNRTSKSK